MMRCDLFCHSELRASVSPGVSVLMLRVVVCECSAADVWQGLSLSLSTKSLFCEVNTAIRCHQNNNILPWTLPPLGKQLRKTAGVTSDGKCSKRGCKHVHFIFVCSRKKRKHWQTEVNSKLKQQKYSVFLNSTDVSVKCYFLYWLVVQFFTITLKQNCQRNLCKSKFALPK